MDPIESVSAPRVFVDADACPVKTDVIRLAGRRGVPVFLVGNAPLADIPKGVEHILVKDTPDAADFEIVTRADAGDIVVTDDIGLASMALPKQTHVVSSRGKIFHDGNIGSLMVSREIGRQIRAMGGHTRGPATFTPRDRSRFRDAFMTLLDRARRHRDV